MVGINDPGEGENGELVAEKIVAEEKRGVEVDGVWEMGAIAGERGLKEGGPTWSGSGQPT